jgi:hypothetical protein
MRDAGTVDPDIRHGQNNVFCEGPITIDADAECMSAEMAAAGKTVSATSADDVAFAADKLSDRDVSNVRAGSDDLPDELMADSQTLFYRRAGPGVPLVDVQVSAADAGGEDANLDIVDAHLRLGDVLEPQTALFAAFD